MRKAEDLTGQKFGLLTVIERDVSSKGGGTKWLCVCDCGKKTVVTASNLKNGSTKSCGCIRRWNNYTFFNDYCIGEDKKGNKFLIDIEDYDLVSQYTWHISSDGYWQCVIKKKTVSMHRLILNAPKGYEVDHKNLRRYDNRKANLRICSRSENAHNKALNKNNSSGVKGVWWDKRNNKWKAEIKINNKRYALGYFENIQEAADKYDEVAMLYFGEFARPNNYIEE